MGIEACEAWIARAQRALDLARMRCACAAAGKAFDANPEMRAVEIEELWLPPGNATRERKLNVRILWEGASGGEPAWEAFLFDARTSFEQPRGGAEPRAAAAASWVLACLTAWPCKLAGMGGLALRAQAGSHLDGMAVALMGQEEAARWRAEREAVELGAAAGEAPGREGCAKAL